MADAVEDIEFDDFRRSLREGCNVEVYTDGSCIGNPGPGGWGAVFVFRDKRSNISGFEKETTNNRMELMAAIKSVEAIPNTVHMTVYTDSTYVKNGITSWVKKWQTNGWKSSSGSLVKNQDLWIKLSQLIADRKIEWCWVKGHSDCMNNNNADFIAKSAIVRSYMKS
jgi:ribonuclease HI